MAAKQGTVATNSSTVEFCLLYRNCTETHNKNEKGLRFSPKSLILLVGLP